MLPAPHLTSTRHFMTQSDNIHQASCSAFKTLNQNVSSLSFTEAVLPAASACYVGLVRRRAGFTPAGQCCNTGLLHLPKCFPIWCHLIITSYCAATIKRTTSCWFTCIFCHPGITCWKTDPGTSMAWCATPARMLHATPKSVRNSVKLSTLFMLPHLSILQPFTFLSYSI